VTSSCDGSSSREIITLSHARQAAEGGGYGSVKEFLPLFSMQKRDFQKITVPHMGRSEPFRVSVFAQMI
jgi:hypothetical protein